MKKLVSLVIAMMLVAAFALSGCSESNANAIPFSETVSGEDICIWYECQNKIVEKNDPYDLGILSPDEEEEEPEPVVFGRETKVVWIRVYQNGKLSTYSALKNVYLGYFAQMTDEEIVKALNSDKDTFICSQKDVPFEIYLYTDSTGHSVMFEGVPTLLLLNENSDPLYYMTLINGESVPTFQVYDSYYGGYTLYNYDETPFSEACLVTRCEEGSVFCLDGIELEGAVLDYETPEDMLHERNDKLREERKAEEGEEGEDGEYTDGETTEGEDAEDTTGTGY